MFTPFNSAWDFHFPQDDSFPPLYDEDVGFSAAMLQNSVADGCEYIAPDANYEPPNVSNVASPSMGHLSSTAVLSITEGSTNQTEYKTGKRERSSSPEHPGSRKRRAKKPRKGSQKIRTVITPESKRILELSLEDNPYPDKFEIQKLAVQCAIGPKAVANWFGNARARKDPATVLPRGGKASIVGPQSLEAQLPGVDGFLFTEYDAAVDTISDVLPTSPAPSMLSLERYLGSPPENEPASREAIEDNIKANYLPEADEAKIPSPGFPLSRPGFGSTEGLGPLSWPFSYPVAGQSRYSGSAAGSVASFGTDCSRSSRRGRKRWHQSTQEESNVSITLATHRSMKQALLDQNGLDEDVPGFAHPGRGSISSQSGFSWPATPPSALVNSFGDGLCSSSAPTMSVIPQFERTYTESAWLDPYRFAGCELLPDPFAMPSPNSTPNRPKDAPYDREKLDYCFPGAAMSTLGFPCPIPGCSKSFQRNCDLTRHQNSVHQPQKVWICCRTDNGFADIKHFFVDGIKECSMCDLEQPTYGHIIEQHFPSCLDKSEEERTFFRRDNLAQHIKQVHLKDTPRPSFLSKLLDLWQRDGG